MQITKKTCLPLAILVLALGACAAFPARARTDARIPFKGPLAVFDLCLDGTPAQKVALLRSMGYSGMGLGSFDPENSLEEIRAYAELDEVKSGAFRVYSALWWYAIKDEIDGKKLDAILVQAARMGMALWPVADYDAKDWLKADGTAFDKEAAVDRAVRQLHIMADHCLAKGVTLVLYPHVGCVFETAEEALAIRQRLADAGHPEVRISIHLCHELKRDNRDRLPEIIRNVAPYLALASISGANEDTFVDYEREYWSTAIMPLDEGTYDVSRYIRALAECGYAGPMELHTYALKRPSGDDYDSHLERSLAAWNALVAPRGKP